jgi:hypothetical protein
MHIAKHISGREYPSTAGSADVVCATAVIGGADHVIWGHKGARHSNPLLPRMHASEEKK